MSTSLCIVASDPTLVYDALRLRIDEALGGLDPSIALQDFTAKDAAATSGDSIISQILEALQTPPFLVERRVVVVRDAQNLTSDEANELIEWMKNPTPDVLLRIALVGTKTHKIAKAAEELITLDLGYGKDEKPNFVRATFANYNVQVDAAALSAVIAHFGDEIERVDSLARTLQNIYGSSPLTIKHISPYLGEAGNVPEWDLTDAIDRGNVTTAITIARRMLDSRGRAGLQIVNMMQRHFLRAARLEGLDLSAKEAATLLGVKSEYTATKALNMARAMGPDRIADAISMITQADLDLKGAVSFGGKDLESDQDVTELTVIEVLVARLARLSAVRR
jgi:DNA polymerase III subunit delta